MISVYIVQVVLVDMLFNSLDKHKCARKYVNDDVGVAGVYMYVFVKHLLYLVVI